MSEQMNFVAYYGDGTVRENATGVDLSEFRSTPLQLPPGTEIGRASCREREYVLV